MTIEMVIFPILHFNAKNYCSKPPFIMYNVTYHRCNF